jgi:hypothetical protein
MRVKCLLRLAASISVGERFIHMAFYEAELLFNDHWSYIKTSIEISASVANDSR